MHNQQQSVQRSRTMNSGLSRLGIALLAAMFAPALLAADLE